MRLVFSCHFGRTLPFVDTAGRLLWLDEKTQKALTEYDDCKKNGIKTTELMRYANNARRWNRASLCPIDIGFVWVALTMPVALERDKNE